MFKGNISNYYLYLQSLKSRAYVTEQFAWRHYYWYLTNEGIQYLRDYLHLPPEVSSCFCRLMNRHDNKTVNAF
jgi:small subunit ribosomal protein S10e